MRVGFVIDNYIPSLPAVLRRGLRVDRFFTGWNTPSPTGLMRFGWIAEAVNQRAAGVRYELFRVWRRYDAVVFLKSFNGASLQLARRLRTRGARIVFDINVDYFTPAAGEFRYDTMAPTNAQREAAIAMAREADAVLAASRHLAHACAPYARRVEWLPDHVNFDLVPQAQCIAGRGPVNFWWSGEAVKLLDLLAIDDVLRKFAGRCRLRLVTGSLAALDKWKSGLKARFESLLREMDAEVITFRNVPELLRRYSEGGFIFSPRYLDNSYNLGHSEWKLTLGMACGLPALASPVPSYVDLAGCAEPGAIRICNDGAEWESALEDAIEGRWGSANAARKVVRSHYATDSIAARHLSLLRSAL
jgi:glycosyltransferase involved in cell wall biosynthesis